MFHITKKNWVGRGFSRRFFFFGACIGKTHRTYTGAYINLKSIGALIIIMHQVSPFFVVCNTDALIIITHRFHIFCCMQH
jgi:hypothetical protein